jgi:hypothetical protein
MDGHRERASQYSLNQETENEERTLLVMRCTIDRLMALTVQLSS